MSVTARVEHELAGAVAVSGSTILRITQPLSRQGSPRPGRGPHLDAIVRFAVVVVIIQNQRQHRIAGGATGESLPNTPLAQVHPQVR